MTAKRKCMTLQKFPYFTMHEKNSFTWTFACFHQVIGTLVLQQGDTHLKTKSLHLKLQDSSLKSCKKIMMIWKTHRIVCKLQPSTVHCSNWNFFSCWNILGLGQNALRFFFFYITPQNLLNKSIFMLSGCLVSVFCSFSPRKRKKGLCGKKEF